MAGGESGFTSRPSGEDLEFIEGLMVQLRRLASNLGQLASREDPAPDEDVDSPAAAEIDEAVLEVREVLDQLRARLR